jgi:EpsI family protein
VLDGWSGPKLHLSDWRPTFANSDEEFLVAYYNDGAGEVALYRAAYHRQRQGKELRGYDNSVLGSSHIVRESRSRELELAGMVVPLSEQVATRGVDQDLLVWSLFAVDGKPDPMEFADLLTYGARALLAHPTASVIALASECRPDCDHARNVLEAFANKALPALLSQSITARTAALGTEEN